uniref:G-patch domain-containing protein n=1 Tax=Megaselia scalaris TaxID=36166 RepID=T1GD82_MEGSC
MLEKMGWTKGKGLGAKEDGSKDFIRIRHKSDNEGFGYEARDDQWTQHEKDFTGLLNNLHGESDENNEEPEQASSLGFGFQATKSTKESMKDKLTGKSLVEMSKTSRARVHYQKFARGKDLSRASEKDLANIFGKKAPTEDNIFSAFQAVNNFHEEEEKKETMEEPKRDGVQIVNTGISISDYFKQKMEALKLKRSAPNGAEDIPSKKSKNEEHSNFEEVSEDQTDSLEEIKVPESEEITKVKSKKKKKEKDPKSSEEIQQTIEEEPKSKHQSEFDSDFKSTSDDDNSSQVQKIDFVPERVSTEKEVTKADEEGEWQEVKSKKSQKEDEMLEQEEQQLDDLTTYRINSYKAEVFRNIDMCAFLGSNISQFKGYGLEAIDKLEVVTRNNDHYKIQQFHKKTQIIFDDADYREEVVQIGGHGQTADALLKMNNYRRKVIVAKKLKKKVPKLDLGAIKKRRAFTGI